jgi:putative phosphoribosyl transferase
MHTRFLDRTEAGRRLARELSQFSGRPDVIVLALPRGGVPVAYQVALELGLPLDVFVVRKLGVPGQPELAMGAVATGGVRVLNERVVRELQIPPQVIDEVSAAESMELRRREQAYRGHSAPPRVRGMTVLLVDDGIATGATVRAAVQALRQQHARRIVVAVPAAARSSLDEIAMEADEAIAVLAPPEFVSVGEWYETFEQTTDYEVKRLLELHHEHEEGPAHV